MRNTRRLGLSIHRESRIKKEKGAKEREKKDGDEEKKEKQQRKREENEKEKVQDDGSHETYL